jgi:hypothetical protein
LFRITGTAFDKTASFNPQEEQKMIVKRIGPLSVGKIAGITYAIIGLLAGGIFSLISLVGASLGRSDQGMFPMLFGVGSIIFFPIFYGILGFIFGIIGAAIYNVVAGVVGGIEIDLQQ